MYRITAAAQPIPPLTYVTANVHNHIGHKCLTSVSNRRWEMLRPERQRKKLQHITPRQHSPTINQFSYHIPAPTSQPENSHPYQTTKSANPTHRTREYYTAQKSAPIPSHLISPHHPLPTALALLQPNTLHNLN